MTKEQLEQFEAFWRTFPRRVGKGAARKAYEKAIKIAPPDEIMTGLAKQLEYLESRPMEFRPHPSTWLNQERWSDEPQPIANNNQRRTITDVARDFIERSNNDSRSPFGIPYLQRH
jgi:hypothetical protein